MSTNDFGKRVAAYQDEILAARDLLENDVEAVRERLFAPQVTYVVERRNWFPGLAFGIVAAAAVGAILFFALPFFSTGKTTRHTQASVAAGEWLNAANGNQEYRFADASRVMLHQGAAARVIEEEGHHVRFLLAKGTAELDVVHHDDTRWMIDCGPYKVRVVGTHFHVSWEPVSQVFSLQMSEGTVELTGPMVEDGRRISGTDSFSASVIKRTFTVQSGDSVASEKEMAFSGRGTSGANEMDSVDGGHVHTGATPSVRAHEKKHHDSGRFVSHAGHGKRVKTNDVADISESSAETLSWRDMNRAGRFKEVVQDAHHQGIAQVLDSKPVSELMALADAARLQKEWPLARNTYLAVRARSPKSSNAQTAAFSIGRIAFDVQRDFSAAAQWLQTYLHEAPNGRLAREAMGRLIEAQEKTGNLTAARTTAAKYLQEYPGGPHAEVARSLQNK